MKLATLRRGGPDGQLIVVDPALERAVTVPQIALTLQQVLDDWARLAPQLEPVAAALANGTCPDTFDLDPLELAAPLPRAFQLLDGSVYLHHMERARRARGAEMPPNYRTEPLMYQGVSDKLLGPRDPIELPTEDLGIDYEAEIAVVLDEVPMGTPASQAAQHVRLLMLMNDITCRTLTTSEIPKGFGFVQAKPASAFSPVALTPDELGDAWNGERLAGRLNSSVNGQLVGTPEASADMFFSYPQLIAHAARTRHLGAGTILAAGAVSNRDTEHGHGCLAEVRMHEQFNEGAARTPWLQNGDTLRIELRDAAGNAPFGAIEQTVAHWAGTGT